MSGTGELFEADLKATNESLKKYIRDKVNHLLSVMGTKPLCKEELDDNTLIELDPIGIIALLLMQCRPLTIGQRIISPLNFCHSPPSNSISKPLKYGI